MALFHALAQATPPRTDDPFSFGAILLLCLALAAIAIGRPVPRH